MHVVEKRLIRVWLMGLEVFDERKIPAEEDKSGYARPPERHRRRPGEERRCRYNQTSSDP